MNRSQLSQIAVLGSVKWRFMFSRDTNNENSHLHVVRFYFPVLFRSMQTEMVWASNCVYFCLYSISSMHSKAVDLMSSRETSSACLI